MSYQMPSLKRFGPVISNNFNKYKHYHACTHTHTDIQTHALKHRNQKASLSAKNYVLLLPGAAFLTTDI